MRFVETPIFTRVITALLDDESYRQLQSSLMRRPEQAATIGGAREARKVRWARDLTPKQTRILAEIIREEFK